MKLKMALLEPSYRKRETNQFFGQPNNIMPSVHSEFYFFASNLDDFSFFLSSFFCLIAVDWTSNTVVSRNGESRPLCLASDFRGNVFRFQY